MLKVSVAEALESDIDTLVMLAKGIAYACGSGTTRWSSACTTRRCSPSRTP